MPPLRRRAATRGIRFTETMKGHFSSAEKQDFTKGEQLGKTEGSSFQFILTITADDADKMLTDSQHAAAPSARLSLRSCRHRP